MCGIVGLINAQVDVTATLHAMCEAIKHRGPDGEGIGAAGDRGIAMRRLSIIDVAGSDQPIYSEDRRLAIVFNGEIYNYQALRAELIACGHTFITQGDTETVIHAYEQWGTSCLTRLNGMFAFAIWNRESGQLFIARDRLGKKPLYYRQDGGRFAFASEIAALRQIPDLNWTLDLTAIHHYLSLQYVPTPLSIYREIAKLPPASYLITDGQTIQIERYWDLDYEPKWTTPLPELRDQLRELVGDAVRIRLQSEVPLGAFLSGGLDSAIVVAEMARQSTQPPETFTIRFAESAFDESPYAAEVAAYLHTSHQCVTVQLDPASDPTMLAAHLDEPFADPSALPMFYLTRHTREKVTVALSGDGSDEVFAGYQRYVLDGLMRGVESVPGILRNPAIGALARFSRPPHDVPTEANWRLGLARLAQVNRLPASASILRWGSYFDEPLKHALYTPAMRAATADHISSGIIEAAFQRAHARQRLDRTLYADLTNYLPDNGHFKVDRLSMQNSVEVRNPFMDVRLVEFAARLPISAKIHGFTQKRLLREAYADRLPPTISTRPKRGFAVPINSWLHGELGTAFESIMLDPAACTAPIFQPTVIKRLLAEHRGHVDDHSKRLWALLMLELWLREHDTPPLAASLP